MYRFVRCLILVTASLAAHSLMASEVVFPPGSRVGLAPPPGMGVSSTFQGFEDRASGSSILTLDMPAEAWDEILPKFSADGMRASGFQGSGAAADWPVGGGEGRVLRGTQTARGLTFRKWVVIARAGGATAMVTVQIPEDVEAAPSDASIETALRTVALRAPQGLEEQIGALPFRIGDRAGFRVVRVLVGSGVLLTEGPADTVRDASQPLVVVASSLAGGPQRSERDAFAKRAFMALTGVKDLSVEADGLDGDGLSRIVGVGVDPGSRAAVDVVQITRFARSEYVRAIGIWRRSDSLAFAARFDRLGRSLGMK